MGLHCNNMVILLTRIVWLGQLYHFNSIMLHCCRVNIILVKGESSSILEELFFVFCFLSELIIHENLFSFTN